MTVRELYQWAEEQNALDLDIEIPYRNGGEYYMGCDDVDYPEIVPRENSYNTEFVVNL